MINKYYIRGKFLKKRIKFNIQNGPFDRDNISIPKSIDETKIIPAQNIQEIIEKLPNNNDK